MWKNLCILLVYYGKCFVYYAYITCILLVYYDILRTCFNLSFRIMSIKKNPVNTRFLGSFFLNKLHPVQSLRQLTHPCISRLCAYLCILCVYYHRITIAFYLAFFVFHSITPIIMGLRVLEKYNKEKAISRSCAKPHVIKLVCRT